MAKKKTLAVVLFLLFFILAAFSLSGRSAYADDIDLHNVDRIAVDLIAADEDGADQEPILAEDGAYEITYGSVLVLRARLDDADAENASSFYDDVYVYYQWLYSKDGTEFAPLNDRIVGETNPSVTLTEHAQSGTYYIRVTNIQYGGDRVGFVGQSEPLKIRVLPKKLTVEYTTTEVVYNGTAQNIGYTVEGEVAGHPAGCVVEYNSSPSDAGTYTAHVFTRNENYSLDLVETQFVIAKAPLIVQAGDVVVLAGYSYEVKITYEGFKGRDNENSLQYPPSIRDEDLAHRDPGYYAVYPDGPTEDKNYTITYMPGTVQVNRSTLQDDSIIGFTGKATGSFSSDAALFITESDKDVVKNSFMFWQIPSAVYVLRFTGASNKDSYTVVMENVELSGWVNNICFVNEEGVTEKVSSFSYDKNKKTLTLVLTQTSGHIVVYHNYLWYVLPGAVLLIIIISLLIFHRQDRNKHKLNRLIAGSAKVEADYYRKKIGEYEEKERRKI
ncbi:MAG: hypothetical protein J5781_00605 [Clostridia bacterium]|nr:hypothetical protein [Clostridia bacterium]